MTKPLLIGQLAKLAGVKPDSVRFYERSGLLPAPPRTEGGPAALVATAGTANASTVRQRTA